ncbi:MAG: hypothetical protein JST80_05205 [Bdellovibrionales bacterium]|nr:hypothetical protein [Bdellovibrionales bacterium]
MKALAIITTLLAGIVTTGLEADAQVRSNVVRSNTNTVAAHLHNIQNQIRACTVLPYSVKNGRKVLHAIVSHCPSVKVISKTKAIVKIGGMTFQIVMRETADSDGDLYDIVIREPISNDRYKIPNVLAFGDVLLGVLVGDTSGLRMSYVAQIF